MFNIVHAPANMTAQAIASVPPLALLLSFELLMTQLRSEVKRQSAINNLDEITAQAETERERLEVITADITAQAETKASLETAIKTLQEERKTVKRAERSAKSTDFETSNDTREAARKFLENAYKEGLDPTGTDVGDHVGRSPSMGRKLKRELWPVITGTQNGKITAGERD